MKLVSIPIREGRIEGNMLSEKEHLTNLGKVAAVWINF